MCCCVLIRYSHAAPGIVLRSVSSARVGGEDRRAELVERASESPNVYIMHGPNTDRDLKPATTTSAANACERHRRSTIGTTN